MKLRVLNGRHRGAEVPLGAEALVIGSQADADIVLSDASVQPRHARLSGETRRHVLAPLDDAAVWHGEQRLAEPLDWRAGDVLRVGDVELVLLHDAASSLDAPVEAIDGPAPEPLHEPVPEPIPAMRAEPAATPRGSAMVLMAMGCLVLATVCGSWLLMGPSHANTAGPAVVRAPLDLEIAQTMLDAEGHRFVKIVRDYRGATVLSGVVDDATQAERVKRWAAAQIPGARVALMTGAELAAKVRTEADDPGLTIGFAGGNRLTVAGVPQRPGTRSKIVRAMGEWSGLVEIQPDLAYLQSSEDSKAPLPQRKALPLKFAMLNVGPSAYIESTDGARYFVGSALPDGSVIRSIDAERVMVEAAGKSIEYRFVN